jgi:alpha-tubulin suppressor-like RCC1 family protein
MAPTLQSATSANSQVTLQWLKRPQLSGSSSISYVVLESSGGLPQTPVNSTPLTGSVYTVNGLTNGTSYVFSVASKNSAGTSLVSNSLSAVPSAVIGEADAPTSVTATAGNTVATIRWSAPLVTGASPITSYAASNGQGLYCHYQVKATNANMCVVHGLLNGKSYKFTVVATNQSGSGPASIGSNAIIPVTLPGQPLNVLATPGNKGAIVSWSAPLHNGKSPILRYNVSDRHGQSCVRAASTPAINSCIVGGLTNGVEYSFVVSATNAIGNGPESRPSKLVKIEPSTPAVQVSAGASFVCAKLIGGAVNCWGDNSFGQLGDASFLNSTTPVSVIGVSEAAQISVGTTHACALIVDAVKCWGDNSFNQLGTAKSPEVDTAELVPNVRGVTSLSAGDNYTCAVTATKTVECWGANNYGQLGNGTVTNTSPPRRVVGLSGVVQVSAGVDHACALLVNATVECWGANNYGQLGNATTIDTSTPVTVVSLTNATQITSGASNSCALLRNGTVSCWGFNGDGELGSGTVASSDVAVAVVGITNVKQISSGQYNTCAVLENATVTCWGAQATALFGNAAPSRSVAPAAIKVLVNVQKISLNSGLSCTLSTHGHVTCWDATSPNPISLWFRQP